MPNTLNIFYLQPKQKADNRIGHAVSIASRNRVKVREIVVHINPPQFIFCAQLTTKGRLMYSKEYSDMNEL